MSAAAADAASATTDPRGSGALADLLDPEAVLRRRQIFRLAFGLTLSSALAFGWAWPLSFITPVITAKLLTTPRALAPKQQIGFLMLLWAGLTLGTELILPVLHYPVVHVLLTGLALFLLFYKKAQGTHPILIVFLLIGVIVVPLIGTIQPSLARAVAKGLFYSAAISVATVYVATALFPDPSDAPPPPTPDAAARERSPTECAALSLRSVAVLFPLVVLFQLYSMTGAAVMLIFAMLLSMEPTYGVHLRAGSGLILANLSGGLVGVLLYQLLVMVPSFWFLLMLCLAAGLTIGHEIFSGTKLGKLLSAGITAVFIVLGPSLTGDSAAGANLATRVGLITAGVIYVVLAFGLLERLTRGRRRLAT
jgi:hypothetical protein